MYLINDIVTMVFLKCLSNKFLIVNIICIRDKDTINTYRNKTFVKNNL